MEYSNWKSWSNSSCWVWSIAAMGYSGLVGTALGLKRRKATREWWGLTAMVMGFVGTAPGLTCLKWNCRFDGWKIYVIVCHRGRLHTRAYISKHDASCDLLENQKVQDGRIPRHRAGFVVLQRWGGLIGASENECHCFRWRTRLFKIGHTFLQDGRLVSVETAGLMDRKILGWFAGEKGFKQEHALSVPSGEPLKKKMAEKEGQSLFCHVR